MLVQSARGAEPDGTLVEVEGEVLIERGARPPAVPARAGDPLRARDRLRTGPDGAALLDFSGAHLRIGPGTTATVGYTSVRIQQGSTWFRKRRTGSTFKILTPAVAVTVRGTAGRVTVDAFATRVALLDGTVDLEVDGRTELLGAGQEARLPGDGTLEIRELDPAGLKGLGEELGRLPGPGGGPRERRPPRPDRPRDRRRGSREGGARSGGGLDRALLENLERVLDRRQTGLAFLGGARSDREPEDAPEQVEMARGMEGATHALVGSTQDANAAIQTGTEHLDFSDGFDDFYEFIEAHNWPSSP